ncbi:hypothetical protein MMC17_003306 [Xylographa soralifera]|nr:hypothetical protein [Xylographa soralifera]
MSKSAPSQESHSDIPNLTLRTPDASIIPHILLYLVQVLALVSPPFRGRAALFGCLILALAIQAHLNPHFTNNVGLAQPFTIGWSYYIATLAKLVFSGEQGPEAYYWRVDRPAKEALNFAAFTWKKFIWALMLVFNQRGIRWNHQVKNVPRMNATRKPAFLARQAYEFVKCLLVADLLFQLSIRLFFTSPDGQIGMSNSKYLTIRHSDWRWSFAKAFVFGATPYFMLSMQYAQLSFFAVLLGFSKPEDWPPPFGRLRDTTTIREFWGTYWHQQLRHMLTSYTDAFIKILKIPRGTNLSSYSTLYIAFILSGAFHALSQLQMPCPTNITPAERTVGFFLFFVWQAVAITVEDLIYWCWRKAGGSVEQNQRHLGRRLVGYLWITASMWASMPLVADTFLRMRMGAESFLPFTVTGPLVQRYVPIPP